MHEDGRRVANAFSSGALGYVTIREVHGVLAEAIREVAEGRSFVSPRAAVALAKQAVSGPAGAAYEELSGQEKQVYRLLGEGESTKQIAAAMNISTRTVESYYARILVKLDLEGMNDLLRPPSGSSKKFPDLSHFFRVREFPHTHVGILTYMHVSRSRCIQKEQLPVRNEIVKPSSSGLPGEPAEG